jgi:adenine/guanine phosphoribosyltransferase-like PRPP-binding protein
MVLFTDMEERELLVFSGEEIRPILLQENSISYVGALTIGEQRKKSAPGPFEDEAFSLNQANKNYASLLTFEQSENFISNTISLEHFKESESKESLYKDYISQINQEISRPENQINSLIIKDLGKFALGSLTQTLPSGKTIPPIAPLGNPNGFGAIPRPSSFSSPSFYKLGRLKPEELPEIALPIIDFIEATQPHLVIGCDRGGRMMSIAVHSAWQQTKDGERFPTVDGKIHFARVSKSVDETILQDDIDRIVEAAMKEAKVKGNELGEDEQMRVLFIDDWVVGGGTKKLAQRLMKKHGAKTYFAVMSGDGADVSGDPDRGSGSVSWHDNPEHIGINYLSSVVRNSDGSTTEKQVVVPVRTEEAASNRKAILKAAKSLGKSRDSEKVA